MLYPVLISILIISGVLFLYVYYIGPKLNPVLRAETFMQQNMVKEAIVEYKKILDRDPDNFVVHYNLAQIYFKRDEIDKGVIHLEHVMRINKYNYEVEKGNVLRMLAQAYMYRNEIDKAFQIYVDIVRTYPGDQEALFNVAFISLGQEYFDIAEKHFKKLAYQQKNSFEVLFGAGIACYQNQSTSEAITYFKDALSIEPHSDVANLAMAFALQRKSDFKTAINYVKMIIDNSNDQNAVFIARRLLAILYLQSRKNKEAVKVLQDLLEHARRNDMVEEVNVLLYDLGFASVRADQTDQAYRYWNELYQNDRGFKEVQQLTMMLRKEMDVDLRQEAPPVAESVMDRYEDWLKETFPPNFMWNICGLKSDEVFDLSHAVARLKTPATRGERRPDITEEETEQYQDNLEQYQNLDVESFRIISNRLVGKLGYKVDEILQTYRESDGVDFMAHTLKGKEKTLVWVRRWKGVQVGEIPLRNFAQAINDMKAKKGLFITTSDLTEAGEAAVSRLSKVEVIYPDIVASALTDLL